MRPSVPLPTLMSWAWCALAIEIDNEFERAMAEADRRPRFGVSLVMWTNFRRFVRPSGISVEHLTERAMVANSVGRSTLGGLERWGYVTFGPTPAGARRDGFGSGRGIRSDMVVRCTRLGRHAQATWPDVARTVEERWRARFGAERVDALSRAVALAAGLVPPPGGWRGAPPYRAQTEARLADPTVALPRHPAVLHRGGWPDGS